MKLLGIDWGERRLGFAVSTDGAWAFPLRVMTIRGFSHAVEVIREIVTAEGSERVVLGLPIGMDGKDTPQTSRVREVAADLGNALNVPIDLIDERLTSQTAQREQHESSARSAADDARAAAAILQTYLEQHPV
jgi:putative Holliday junction resolvase